MSPVLSKADFIEVQIASMSLIETLIYRRMLFSIFMFICERKYKRYVAYTNSKLKVKESGKELWEKIQSRNA